jgi:hypothetical protein
MKKIILLSTFLITLVFSTKTLLAQSSSKDTTKKENKITKDLILLPTISNFMYMLPPEKSFQRDTNGVFLGMSSEKYPGVTFSFILRGSDYEEDENVIKEKNTILKQGVMRINDNFDLWYYKLSSKVNPQLITWSIFFKNAFFYGNALFSYLEKDDKILGKGIEKTINSFVIIQRPDIVPTQNVIGIGNFDSIPLKFVQKRTYPVAYYTEDGLPITHTKGAKIFVFVTGPRAHSDYYELSEAAVLESNKIFRINNLNDSVIVENIESTTMMEVDGIKLSGSLASDNKRSFISYYIKVPDKDIFFLVFGICNAADKKEFDKVLDNFRKTAARNPDI